MDDAYAVQNAIYKAKLTAGQKVIGWKIGLTSKAMQYALNIDIPDSGILFDDMLFETGATVSKGRFIQPRIEAEIAFVMKSTIGGADVNRADVIAATDYVAPSIEILDTRILRTDPVTGQTRNVCDTISDNAAMRALFWVQNGMRSMRSICVGWVRWHSATMKSRKQVWVPVY
ncbi:HpcG [Caligus rogercresseyi]|uniref:HpcG n=1 Tax=Caligus rogercresseyi TaxID=217165 RepID=A0A7T8KBD5_CALRO|nr:HpcG [Caligus rogercresseyi]